MSELSDKIAARVPGSRRELIDPAIEGMVVQLAILENSGDIVIVTEITSEEGIVISVQGVLPVEVAASFHLKLGELLAAKRALEAN